MTKEEWFSSLIKETGVDSNLISDGYHTFGELYEHRITLYITLLKIHTGIAAFKTWRSKKHSDGSEWEGWFILGYDTRPGHQITYHLPISKWQECDFADTLDQAPEWDGHTSNDVLERLKSLL